MAEINWEDPDAKKALEAEVGKRNKELADNRDEILTEKRGLERKLKAYEGIDPDHVKELEEAEADRRAKDAKRKGDWDKREQQLKDEFDKILKGKDDDNQSLSSDLEHHLVGNAIKESIAAEHGSLRLLEPHVRESVRIEKSEDGARIAVVVDEKGNRRLKEGAKTTGDYMSIRDFVKTLREDKDLQGAFDGSGSSGSGSPQPHGSGGDRTAKMDGGAKIL